MSSHHTTLVWLRRDLRLEDQPALYAAAERGAVVPVFIWNPEEDGAWAPGGASRWWLHFSLAALQTDLEKTGGQLVLRQGDSLETLQALIEETGADAVYWNRLYEPEAIARDTRIKAALTQQGIEARSFNGSLLIEPPEFFNKQGGPWKVFTPFYKAALRDVGIGDPLPAVEALPAPKQWPADVPLETLDLLPRIDWAAGIRATWTPGETGAWEQVERFKEGVAAYKEDRDKPQLMATSRLSPHLHFGEISPRAAITAIQATEDGASNGAQHFVSEMYWREFGHYLLFHFPETTVAPLRPEFEAFPWHDDPEALRAWQRGRTGYPLVDAGMRELWKTGWMHNRVRMVVASFLVKHLLIPWQQGAAWFWDTLVDADLANNTLGWQWTAGCGADAAPYFRVFNPVLQGLKFDPEGEYIARYVPELAALPAKYRHEPWLADDITLRAAGVVLGDTYPHRIVDHGEARDAALAAYQAIKTGGPTS
ncbi:MAG: deoxyribodipyrimidine photo-lyase [Candidatus Hydrogenedens sp.]|nr:deoxyribodipyrimidine photo-lyase [Candidatus Hydrogenedens sp.]